MTDAHGGGAAEAVVRRVTADDWRLLREVRLAALADAPLSFASSRQEEATYPEARWRGMTSSAAMFATTVGATPVGMVAGLRRDADDARGLGAMWVAPAWRGRGVASALADAVVTWAIADGGRILGLWVPTDNARAVRFYERQGFEPTDRCQPFPGRRDRSIRELRMLLHGSKGD